MLTVYKSTMIIFSFIAISLFAVLSTTTTNMVGVTGFATVPLATTRHSHQSTTLQATPFLFGFLSKKADDDDDDDKSAKNKKAAAATTKKNAAAVKAKSGVKKTSTYNSRSK
jgi:hypothetical protein